MIQEGERLFYKHFILSILIYGILPGVVSFMISPMTTFIVILPILAILSLFHAHYLYKIITAKHLVVKDLSDNLLVWSIIVLAIGCLFRVFFIYAFEMPLEKVLIFILAFLVILFSGRAIQNYGFTTRRKLLDVLVGILIYIVMFAATLAPLYALLILFGARTYFDLVIFLIGLPSMLVVGLGEEALFRGLLQRVFIEKFGYRIGIFLASFLLFALWHLVWISEYPSLFSFTIYILAAGLLGILLGLAFEGSKGLLPVIVAHGLWDIIASSFYMSQPITEIHLTLYIVVFIISASLYVFLLLFIRRVIRRIYEGAL